MNINLFKSLGVRELDRRPWVRIQQGGWWIRNSEES